MVDARSGMVVLPQMLPQGQMIDVDDIKVAVAPDAAGILQPVLIVACRPGDPDHVEPIPFPPWVLAPDMPPFPGGMQ